MHFKKKFQLVGENSDDIDVREGVALLKRGDKDSVERALRHFEKAFNRDDPDSCYWLGCFALYGIVYPKSVEVACAFFRAGVEIESAACKYMLSGCYHDGANVRPDPDMEMMLLQQAADELDVNACYVMGKVLCSGYGVERNLKKGLRYLIEAAIQWDVPSFEELVNLNNRGFWVNEECKKISFTQEEEVEISKAIFLMTLMIDADIDKYSERGRFDEGLVELYGDVEKAGVKEAGIISAGISPYCDGIRLAEDLKAEMEKILGGKTDATGPDYELYLILSAEMKRIKGLLEKMIIQLRSIAMKAYVEADFVAELDAYKLISDEIEVANREISQKLKQIKKGE